jgi:thioredoxin-related protein
VETKMKKLLTVLLTIGLSLSALTMNVNATVELEEKQYILKSNEAYLFYMYSNEKGHFFLDPTADCENVVWIVKDDWKIDSNFKIDTKSLHHGKKFIGTFVDDEKWELESIKEVLK